VRSDCYRTIGLAYHMVYNPESCLCIVSFLVEFSVPGKFIHAAKNRVK
jgi:hypothetical protein